MRGYHPSGFWTSIVAYLASIACAAGSVSAIALYSTTHGHEGLSAVASFVVGCTWMKYHDWRSWTKFGR